MFAGGAEVIGCVLLCMLEAVEGVLCLLQAVEGTTLFMELLEVSEVLEVSEMLEAMRRVLSVCWRPLRVGSVRWRCCEVRDMPEVTRCVLLCMLEAVEGRLCFGFSKFP